MKQLAEWYLSTGWIFASAMGLPVGFYCRPKIVITWACSITAFGALMIYIKHGA